MGSKPKNTVSYVGPSPEEINRQYQMQQQLLAQQEAAYQNQYNQQINEMRSQYDYSIGLLTQQMMERENANSALLGQLNTQLQSSQEAQTQMKGLYDSLLLKQNSQAGLAEAEQNRAMQMAGDARTQRLSDAQYYIQNSGQRRQAAQQSRGQAGSMGAYGRTGMPVGSGLLR